MKSHPSRLLKESGKVVWAARYDAWGKVKRLVENAVEQPLRLQGQYFDEETGLHYNRFRYYEPRVGSFISQDPLGMAAGENVYSFGPNAQGWIDPLGLCKKSSKVDPAAMARSWQGKGAYSGVDDWQNTVIRKGTKVWGGAPGQTNFYTTDEMIKSAGNDATKTFKGLQVDKGIFPQFRPGMTQYEVNKDFTVGYSKALANPKYGAGGFDQYFIPEPEKILNPIKSIILTNR